MKKKLHCAYLFADGHAVLVYEKHDRKAGDIRWAEVVEKFGPECRFTGRIMFDRANQRLLNLCRRAVGIRAAPATLELQVRQRQLKNVWVHGLSSVLGVPYTYQPEADEQFDPEISRWANYRVTKVHRLPVKPKRVQAPAKSRGRRNPQSTTKPNRG